MPGVSSGMSNFKGNRSGASTPLDRERTMNVHDHNGQSNSYGNDPRKILG